MPDRIIFADNSLLDFEEILTELGFGRYRRDEFLKCEIRKHPDDPYYKQKNPHIYILTSDKIMEEHRAFAKPSNQIHIAYTDFHTPKEEEFCGLAQKLYSEFLPKLVHPVIVDPAGTILNSD